MRLSDLGELGLLAELERRGLARASSDDAAAAPRRPRRHAGRARRGRPLPARLDLVARPRLARRSGEPQRPRRLRRRAEGAARHARPRRTTPTLDDVLELYEGIAETGVPVVGGDTSQRRQRRAERDRARPVGARARAAAGARPATCSSSPVRSAPPAPRSAAAYVRPPLRLAEGTRARRDAHTRCSTSPTGSPSTPGTSRARSGVPARDRARPRPARARARARRPRLRRGLRAACGGRRDAGRVHGRSAASRRAKASS